MSKSAKAKDLRRRLEQSLENHQQMESRFGFIPLSVLKLSRSRLSKQVYIYQQEQPARSTTKTAEQKQKAQDMRDAGYTLWKQNPAGRGTGRGKAGATIMPAELVEFFVKYYSEPGQVYLDPFMGQGIQMQVAHMFGLEYWGYDISREFFAYIQAVKNRLADSPKTHIWCADSTNPIYIPNGIGDFSFTSPPYWDIEYYGDEPEQLGTGHTYEDFLSGMTAVAMAWYPKFKSGAWNIINVNDFRKDGRFYCYHADTIRVFMAAGWTLHDIWIIDELVGSLPKAFAVSFNMKRMAPKVHEYALVFRKE